MKIKHFAGYGSVEATRIKSKDHDLVIKVKGDHEQGIYRNDIYDVFRWLVQRFDKSAKNMHFRDWQIMHYPTMNIKFEYENGVESCIYIFDYEE